MSKQPQTVLPIKQRYELLFCALVRLAIKQKDTKFFQGQAFIKACAVFEISDEARQLIVLRVQKQIS